MSDEKQDEADAARDLLRPWLDLGGDPFERIAAALERIADALEGAEPPGGEPAPLPLPATRPVADGAAPGQCPECGVDASIRGEHAKHCSRWVKP